MTVTSVVFDLDGTLVDSSPDIAAALNEAFVPLGVRELSAPEVLAMLGGGPRILVSAALTAVGGPTDDASIDALVEEYSVRYRANPAGHTLFFADAAEALPVLKERGVLLAICTNKRTDIADAVLTHLGVRDLFGAVIGSDIATAPKPDAAHLEDALRAIGADAAGCLYVGDTQIDATTADAANVRYVHVDWGHELQVAPRQIAQFSELLTLIDQG